MWEVIQETFFRKVIQGKNYKQQAIEYVYYKRMNIEHYYLFTSYWHLILNHFFFQSLKIDLTNYYYQIQAAKYKSYIFIRNNVLSSVPK